METQQKKIAVLILNWNGKELLKKFLPTICLYNHHESEIIVIDNNSNDESLLFLTKNYPKIKRIEFYKNFGFAEAYNKAISIIKNKYVVLLNSDVRVSKNWLIGPYQFLESETDYAVCQPKILDEKNPNKFEYAGASGGFIDHFGYPFCRGRLFNSLEEDTGQYNTNINIMWASGAALMIKRSIYQEVGGLDASFFAHQEEIDLCWRVLNHGYKIACIPSSKVYHLGGGTLNKDNPSKTFLNFRNNLVMLLKNLPKSSLYIIFFRLILDGLAAFIFILKGKPNHCISIIRAHFSFYIKIPNILFKRKKTIKLPNNLKYSGLILYDYYVKGVKSFKQINKSMNT